MGRQKRSIQWSFGGRPAGILALMAVHTLAATALGGCCLVRPPDAKTLFAAGTGGWRTPEAAFETFRVAFGADLPELEFRSLSNDFRRRENISYQTYLIARQKLIEDHPLMTLLANAEVVESIEGDLGSGRHRLVVQAAGRRFGVELVREDRFQTYSGAVFLADGPLDFDRAVRVEDVEGGKRITTEVIVPEAELEGVDLAQLSSHIVERVWKIDRFLEGPQAP